jgi:hypothetical protein
MPAAPATAAGDRDRGRCRSARLVIADKAYLGEGGGVADPRGACRALCQEAGEGRAYLGQNYVYHRQMQTKKPPLRRLAYLRKYVVTCVICLAW